MNRLIALLLSVSLVLPACSAARPPRTVPADPSALPASEVHAGDAAWERYVRALPPGIRVRVVERGGPRYTATLLGVEQEEVVLQRTTRVPEPPRRVRIDRIASLARHEGDGMGVGKAVLIGVSAGAATFFGLLLAAFAAIED